MAARVPQYATDFGVGTALLVSGWPRAQESPQSGKLRPRRPLRSVDSRMDAMRRDSGSVGVAVARRAGASGIDQMC